MQLSKYISELLYRYECVMVPNFGGFVSNTISCQLDSTTHQFTPPSKNISFNIHLQQNDGLLINHIATALQISFDEAANQVQKTVDKWNTDLQIAPLLLTNIGQFALENDQLTFEPAHSINYLSTSFGLSDVDANYMLRHNLTSELVTEEIVSEKLDAEETETPVIATRKKSYKKYIAAAAIVGGLFLAGNYFANTITHQQEIADQQEITTQIQQASFNILSPLPSITLVVEKEEVAIDETIEISTADFKYHIIAGAFKDANNAEKKVAILNNRGYDAQIMGLNKWGLTQVSYASFNNKTTAIYTLNKIRKQDNKHAWLFVK